jgi:sensor histidine kinase YesM
MTPYYIDKRTISTDYRSDRAYNMNFWTSDVQEAPIETQWRSVRPSINFFIDTQGRADLRAPERNDTDCLAACVCLCRPQQKNHKTDILY